MVNRPIDDILGRPTGSHLQDERLAEIDNRYFSGGKTFDYVDLRAFHRRIRTRLPRYRERLEAYPRSDDAELFAKLDELVADGGGAGVRFKTE